MSVLSVKYVRELAATMLGVTGWQLVLSSLCDCQNTEIKDNSHISQVKVK